MTKLPIKAYAIVLKSTREACYTSAPEILNGGHIYQIYLTRDEAENFLKLRFYDAEYDVVEVCVEAYTTH